MGAFLFSTTKTAGNFGDVWAYHLPLRELAASRLQQGQVPFWNPYLFGGEPMLANPQAGLFYPLSALFQLWPALVALNWSLLLHSAMALLGMQLLARRSGLSAAGAAALGAAYAFSPFLLCRLPQGVPTLLYGLAYIPWTWLFFDKPALLSLTLALQFLSGHPQFMAANLLGLSAALLVRRRSALAAFAAAGAWSGLLVAGQLAPTLEFLHRSVRVAWSTLFKTGYSLPPIALGTLIYPNIIGNPMQGGSVVPPSVFFEVFNLYVSIAVLALAVVGLARGGWKLPSLLLFLGFFLALGENNPFYRMMTDLPFFSSLRAPARFSILILWGLLLAAVRGWRWAAPRAPDWRWRAGALALIVLDLALWGRRLVYAQDATPFMAANPGIMRAFQDDPLHRAATSPDLANPNKLMLYRLRNATGYEAFYLASAAEYTSRSQGGASADGSRTYVRRIDTPGMEAWGVKYLLESSGGAPRVVENIRAAPIAYLDSTDPVELVRAEPEHWRALYNTSMGGAVIATEAFYPGWRAWVNGGDAGIEKWNGFMMAVAIPRGTGRVDLFFRPTGWLLWLALTLAGWAGLAMYGRWLLEP
jgi:hypothetical protein